MADNNKLHDNCLNKVTGGDKSKEERIEELTYAVYAQAQLIERIMNNPNHSFEESKRAVDRLKELKEELKALQNS